MIKVKLFPETYSDFCSIHMTVSRKRGKREEEVRSTKIYPRPPTRVLSVDWLVSPRKGRRLGLYS